MKNIIKRTAKLLAIVVITSSVLMSKQKIPSVGV